MTRTARWQDCHRLPAGWGNPVSGGSWPAPDHPRSALVGHGGAGKGVESCGDAFEGSAKSLELVWLDAVEHAASDRGEVSGVRVIEACKPGFSELGHVAAAVFRGAVFGNESLLPKIFDQSGHATSGQVTTSGQHRHP